MVEFDWLRRLTGRQHVAQTAHKRTSIFARPRIPTGIKPHKYSHKREVARRLRQIERGMLKVG